MREESADASGVRTLPATFFRRISFDRVPQDASADFILEAPSRLDSCMPAGAMSPAGMLQYACLLALASGARMGATARGAAARSAGVPGPLHSGGVPGHHSWPSSLSQADLPAPPPQPPLDLGAATPTTHTCLWDSGNTCVRAAELAQSDGRRRRPSFARALAAARRGSHLSFSAAAAAAAAVAALPPQRARPQRRVGPQRLCQPRPALPPRVARRRLPLHPGAVRRRGRRRAACV